MVDDTVPAARAAALAGFADTGPDHLNCAQAVVRFAALLLGAREDSVVLARYMGGGMAGTGEVCGALSGAALSTGLRDQHRGFSPADDVPSLAKEQTAAAVPALRGGVRSHDLQGAGRLPSRLGAGLRAVQG